MSGSGPLNSGAPSQNGNSRLSIDVDNKGHENGSAVVPESPAVDVDTAALDTVAKKVRNLNKKVRHCPPYYTAECWLTCRS
jgi:hypothetical protein